MLTHEQRNEIEDLSFMSNEIANLISSNAILDDDEDYQTLLYLRKKYSRSPTPPSHHNPADYNITQEEADRLRIRYLNALRRTYREQVDIFHRFAASPHVAKSQMWFIMWQYNHWVNKVKEVERKIDAVIYRQKYKEQEKSFDIPRLKEIPIENFVEVNTQNNSFKLREEKTASCHLYRNENKWWDFGTNEGGDVIDLIQKLNDCTFIEACKYLNNK